MVAVVVPVMVPPSAQLPLPFLVRVWKLAMFDSSVPLPSRNNWLTPVVVEATMPPVMLAPVSNTNVLRPPFGVMKLMALAPSPVAETEPPLIVTVLLSP